MARLIVFVGVSAILAYISRDSLKNPRLHGFYRFFAWECILALILVNYVRHPLYSSLLLLGWGAFFKNPSWIGLGLAACATLFLVATARVEETENVRYFGPEYREYMRRTRMFIPYLL